MEHITPTSEPKSKAQLSRPVSPTPQQFPLQPFRPTTIVPASAGRRQAAWQAIQRRLNSPLIQRDIPNEQYKGTHAIAAQTYALALDSAVQKAWAAVQATPLLGKLADYDGHTQLWADKMEDFAKTNSDPGGLHTSFGYVIESLATGPLKPDAPSGYHITLQGSRGGTRPDVILRHGFMDAAWLDITASNSANHIFNKEGGWQQVGNFAEITYPSVDISEMVKMKNKANVTAGDELNLGIDPQKIMQEKIAAQKALAEKRIKWQRMGNQWLAPVKKIRKSLLANADEIRANKSKEILMKNLDIKEELDDRTAASIIRGMNLNPLTYGFATGVSVSMGTGISILQDIDPEETVVKTTLSPKEKEEKRKKEYKATDYGLTKEKRDEKDNKDRKDRRQEIINKNRGLTKDMDDDDL